MWWAIVAAVAPAVFRAIGEAFAQGDRAKAEELRQKAMDQYNIQLPQIDSELLKVYADPKYKQAENQTLDRLQAYSTGSGLMPEDVATLEAAKREAANVASGLRGRNQQEMAARGISGSGIDLSNQLGYASREADSAYQGAIQAAADASRRRQQALVDSGNFASRLSQQDLAQRNARAQAQDAINRYNTADKRDVRDRMADLLYRQGDYTDTAANRILGTISDIGVGVGQGAAAYGQYQNAQDAAKARAAQTSAGSEGSTNMPNYPPLALSTPAWQKPQDTEDPQGRLTAEDLRVLRGWPYN